MEAFLARQPIFDRQRQIYGYELLYRSASSDSGFDGTEASAATRHVLASSLLSIGLETILCGKKAFVNFNEHLLRDGIYQSLPRDATVIEILETVEPTADLLALCRGIREEGYTIALDDFVAGAKFEPLTQLAQLIKVDMRATAKPEQQRLIRTYQPRGIALLAEKVETYQEFEWAHKAGYDYFQGYFFAKPTVVSSADISLLQSKCLRILQKTFEPDYEPKEVEAVIKPEPSLCYRLLRYLDSAAFGLYPIRSIGHALTILGQRETQKWVALVTAVMLGKKTSTALVSMALVRARFCELMAGELAGPSTDYFLMGLLSLMDVLLSQPMSAVLAQLPISSECRAALEGQENSLSRILQLMVACERGEWGLLSLQCSTLNTAESEVWSLYSQAIEWARSFTSER